MEAEEVHTRLMDPSQINLGLTLPTITSGPDKITLSLKLNFKSNKQFSMFTSAGNNVANGEFLPGKGKV